MLLCMIINWPLRLIFVFFHSAFNLTLMLFHTICLPITHLAHKKTNTKNMYVCTYCNFPQLTHLQVLPGLESNPHFNLVFVNYFSPLVLMKINLEIYLPLNLTWIWNQKLKFNERFNSGIWYVLSWHLLLICCHKTRLFLMFILCSFSFSCGVLPICNQS